MTQKAVATTLTPVLYIHASAMQRSYIYHSGVGSCCSPASKGNARSQIVRVGIRSSRPRFCRIRRHTPQPHHSGQSRYKRYMCAPCATRTGLDTTHTLTSIHVSTFLFILFFPKGISKRFRDAFMFLYPPCGCVVETTTRLRGIFLTTNRDKFRQFFVAACGLRWMKKAMIAVRPCNGRAVAGAQMRLG